MLEDDVNLPLVTVTEMKQLGTIVQPGNLAIQFHRHESLAEHTAEVEIGLDTALVGAHERSEQSGIGHVSLWALDRQE